MRFLVRWKREADKEALELWVHSDDPDRTMFLINQVIDVLSRDPETVGMPRYDTVREYVAEAELGVEYEVIPDDMHVMILDVWDHTKGKPGPSGN